MTTPSWCSSPIGELDDGGNLTTVYTHGVGGLVSLRRAAGPRYYHFDGLGSTVELTDAAENVTDSYRYEAFGNLTGQTGNTRNAYRYVGSLGYYADADSGLMLLGARYYAPAVGRFVTVDPAREGGDGYGYAANNPVNGVDPSGHIAWWIACLFPCGCAVGVPLAAILGCVAGGCAETGYCLECVKETVQDFAGLAASCLFSCLSCLVGRWIRGGSGGGGSGGGGSGSGGGGGANNSPRPGVVICTLVNEMPVRLPVPPDQPWSAGPIIYIECVYVCTNGRVAWRRVAPPPLGGCPYIIRYPY
ncbi:MAG: RHS repeat-associated core domain-containing protein [candidate division WOR-3 bacterium]